MDDQSTLLQLQELKIANVKRKEEKKDAVGLWDPGSTLSFITFDLASSLGLQGQPVKLEIVTVGGVLTKVKSRKYHLSEDMERKNSKKMQCQVFSKTSLNTTAKQFLKDDQNLLQLHC